MTRPALNADRCPSSWAAIVAALMVGLLAAGCDPPQRTRAARGARSGEQSAADVNLVHSMELLDQIHEFDFELVAEQAVYQFNQWARDHQPPADWSPDTLLERLPREIREAGLVDGLDARQFSSRDVDYLREAIWFRLLSQFVATQPRDANLAAWVQRQSLSPIERDQLLLAERLFDWTIRHIQLEPLTPYQSLSAETSSAAAPAADSPAPSATPISEARQGILGPGYGYFPWQAALFGRGDAWQRARVFLLLARQQGIDVVMLALPGQSIPPRPNIWLPAVLLQGELYLFDAALGLPLASVDPAGIATLREVQEHPELLTRLDLESHPYSLQPAQLASVVALLDAAPQALSLRMRMIEQNLTGEHRIVLTTQPSRLAAALRDRAGIADVGFLRAPYETIWFTDQVQLRMERDQAFAALYMANFGLFTMSTDIRRGRALQIRGELDNTADELRAKSIFLRSRLPRHELAAIGESKEIQARFGLVRGDDSDLVWQSKLATVAIMAGKAKQCATYWLGLAHYDSANYDAAVSWLKERVLEQDPQSPWAAGARYNLARAYEALGEREQAAKLLLQDESPQRHGNILRAQRLRQQTVPAPKAATAN